MIINFFIDDTIMEKKITGINIPDFLKILKSYNILVGEDDKVSIRDAFILKLNQEYLDIENIYYNMESFIAKEDASEFGASFIDKYSQQGQLSAQDEQSIYKKIGDCLRVMNINIEQAFKFIDQDKNEMISEIEFRKLLKSLHIILSDRETNLLVIQLQLVKGMIPKQVFIEKFRNAYAPSVTTLKC